MSLTQASQENIGVRAPVADWERTVPGAHIAQFYESDAYLLKSLQSFLSPGLRQGEVAIVVATEPHRWGLARLLEADGIDIEALRASGRYIAHDAATLLGRFMRNGAPVAELFNAAVGDVIAPALAAGAPIRIYGEMVSILWAQGQQDAALRVEELWHELQIRHPFSLCCGYPMSSFSGRAMEGRFAQVCDRHSRVHPTESYSSAANEDERLRAIARMQQQIVSLEREAHEAVHMRNQFLVAASHDLRTPLSVILGYAQMLRRRLGTRDGDDGRTSEGLQSIERRARMMASVVEELADATRLESGGAIALHRDMVDLAGLVEEVVREQGQVSPRHRLIAVIGDRPIVGYWDPVRLSRAVVNLIGNAVKYSPDGGDIIIRLARDGDSALLSVQDSGIGIAPADLSHIFDRFFRGANALDKTSGTGIGLSSARQIIERHGGTISVESVEGRGSTFVVRLPVTVPPESADS